MTTSADGPFESLIELLADKIAERLIAATRANTTPDVGERDAPPWMSVTTAAAYLDWPRQRLYKLTAQNAIPHYKHDGRLLFHRQELDLWLTEFRQAGGDWMNDENRAISP